MKQFVSNVFAFILLTLITSCYSIVDVFPLKYFSFDNKTKYDIELIQDVVQFDYPKYRHHFTVLLDSGKATNVRPGGSSGFQDEAACRSEYKNRVDRINTVKLIFNSNPKRCYTFEGPICDAKNQLKDTLDMRVREYRYGTYRDLLTHDRDTIYYIYTISETLFNLAKICE